MSALVEFNWMNRSEEATKHYTDEMVKGIIKAWGNWSHNHTGCGWYFEAPGMRNVLPVEDDYRDILSDNDALIVDSIIASMYSPENEMEMSYFILHYVYGVNKYEIGRRAKVSEKQVRVVLLLMEQHVSGALNWRYKQGHKLDRDK